MITFLANLVIPLFIFTLVLYGTLKRKDIYTPFLEGVMDGFKIVLEIANSDRFVFCDSDLSFFWSLGSDRSFSDSYGKTIKDS